MKKRTFLASLLSLPALAFMSKKAATKQKIGIKDKHGKDICVGDTIVHDFLSYGWFYGKQHKRVFKVVPILHQNSLTYCLQEEGDTPIYNIWEGHEVEIV